MRSMADLHDFSIGTSWGECGIVGESASCWSRNSAPRSSSRPRTTPRTCWRGQRPEQGETAMIFRREDGVRRDVTWDQLRAQVGGSGTARRGRRRGRRGGRLDALEAIHGQQVGGETCTSTSPEQARRESLIASARSRPGVPAGRRRIRVRRQAARPNCRADRDRPREAAGGVAGRVVADAGIHRPPSAPLNTLARPAEPLFVQLPFDHPDSFSSSGTTGKPKGLVLAVPACC